MSSNNDNAMTRFLFAILQQKNLKDIDWNKVAHDPILAQEITNGHAARMRYSRFKSAMLGLEPTRRNRTAPAKSRVTKSKKDSKSKRSPDSVKSESAAGSPPAPSPEPPLSAPRVIKQENLHYPYNSRLTPALTPGPPSMPLPIPPASMTSAPMLQTRFLTPCSDADMYASSPVLACSPASDMVHSQNSYDYHESPCPEPVDPAWPHNNTHFADAFPFHDYSAPPCDHQHMYHTQHMQDPLTLPNQSIEESMDRVDVKHEDWEQFHH
ncbi:hypothetical protein F5Y18DRAFT_98652 [Xylariaceae sp. FL1019]|nr:hypothetical protein F5Y18DRAFT_98652 [Xylariaceae sp. FL1019]